MSATTVLGYQIFISFKQNRNTKSVWDANATKIRTWNIS